MPIKKKTVREASIFASDLCGVIAQKLINNFVDLLSSQKNWHNILCAMLK
jgi:hypothetical protein